MNKLLLSGLVFFLLSLSTSIAFGESSDEMLSKIHLLAGNDLLSEEIKGCSSMLDMEQQKNCMNDVLNKTYALVQEGLDELTGLTRLNFHYAINEKNSYQITIDKSDDPNYEAVTTLLSTIERGIEEGGLPFSLIDTIQYLIGVLVYGHILV